MRAFEVQRVVHGNRDLVGHLLKKVQMTVVKGNRFQPPEAHPTDPTQRGSERQDAEGLHSKGLHHLYRRGKP